MDKILTGVVESLDDPEKLGRVKVRLHTLHSDLKVPNMQSGEGIPTDFLTWAMPIQSITSAALKGVGISPTGLQIGTWVVCMSLNNTLDALFIFGTLASREDVHESALGLPHEISDNKKADLYKDEPESLYASKYPCNKTNHTKSGHLLEVDDTPGKERIQVYHKSGTFVEISPDGVRVEKTVGDNFSIAIKNNNMYAKGVINIYAEDDCNITSDKVINIKAKGDCNITSDKNINVEAKDNVNIKGKHVEITAKTMNISKG